MQLGLCKPLAVNLSIAEDAGPGQLVGFLSASTRSAVFVVGRSLHIRVVPPFGLCVETRFVMDFILIFLAAGILPDKGLVAAHIPWQPHLCHSPGHS